MSPAGCKHSIRSLRIHRDSLLLRRALISLVLRCSAAWFAGLKCVAQGTCIPELLCFLSERFQGRSRVDEAVTCKGTRHNVRV